MLYQSNYLEEQAVMQTATRMCAAARTAPKAHGKDTLYTFAYVDLGIAVSSAVSAAALDKVDCRIWRVLIRVAAGNWAAAEGKIHGEKI